MNYCFESLFSGPELRTFVPLTCHRRETTKEKDGKNEDSSEEDEDDEKQEEKVTKGSPRSVKKASATSGKAARCEALNTLKS